MAVSATRKVVIAFGDDFAADLEFKALTNIDSPGAIWNSLLEIGPNTILIPTGENVVKAVTIIPPDDNISILTLKGIAGDTGLVLHLTDPTSIALAEGILGFVLDVSADVVVKFVWT